MYGRRAVVYRAMRSGERLATLQVGKPAFMHGCKFFSLNLGWIATRVRDGIFARGAAGATSGDYDHVMAFDLLEVDLSLFRKLNAMELSLSRRDGEFLEARITDVSEAELRVAALKYR